MRIRLHGKPIDAGQVSSGRDIRYWSNHRADKRRLVLGSSMGASSAAWAAAERPAAIAGLVLYGPLLREPGRLRSFRDLAVQLDHSVVEARLAQISSPLRSFIGDGDPDFADPAAESAWINGLGGHSEIVPEAGHYPHAQRPDIVVPATLAFLAEHCDPSTGTWKQHA